MAIWADRSQIRNRIEFIANTCESEWLQVMSVCSGVLGVLSTGYGLYDTIFRFR